MLDIGREEGVVEEEEENIIKQVLKFSETSVGDVMTLPKDFEAIEAGTEKKDIAEFLDEHEHAQYLVYKDNFDDVRGIIGAHELHKMIKKSRKNKPLLNFKRRPLVMVPRATSLTELFKELKEKKQRMAAVLDEHGQTVGLVTLGDIMNEITKGEIDETPACTVMKKEDENAWEACGETLISEIEKELEIKIGYPEHVTIGFIILEELKRFPDEGEKIDLGLIKVEVLKISKKTIDKVLIRKAHLTKKQKKELAKQKKEK
jgi:putative hemolysin